ncbi:MAG: citrate/2-methylcitrate synthase [Pseudomonadales bacterium]|nr:citrate/2-methylcitrate synthase [Pseudomonadales bacterium]
MEDEQNAVTDPPRVHRGLKGVYFERSDTTFIDGRAGELRYRGYSIHDLAAHSTFEETTYLLLHGELPTREQLTTFDEALKAGRTLPAEIYDIIEIVKDAHPMEVLRTAVSALGTFEANLSDDSTEAILDKGTRLTSQVPIIVTAHHRMRQGFEPIAPNSDLGHAANFLYMVKDEIPSSDAARLMDLDMVLHAEHGSNASSFTARVVAGTDANLHAAVTAAIAALSGPAHGGAAENVMHMAREVGEVANVKRYIRNKRKNREPIMGFGHRVYRAEDPRARHLRAGVERLSQGMGEPHWNEILQALVEAMKPYARHGVNVNVDFYSGVIYHLHGLPEDLFVPIFAMGRVPGWTLHVHQQLLNNILIRPLLLYDGPEQRDYISIDKRE